MRVAYSVQEVHELVAQNRYPRRWSYLDRIFPAATTAFIQGGLDPSKISGVGTNFGLLVHVLPGPSKRRALEPSMILSWIWRQSS